MKLSASEQQRLDEIEQGLTEDDPRLAILLAGRSPDPGVSPWRRALSALVSSLAAMRV